MNTKNLADFDYSQAHWSGTEDFASLNILLSTLPVSRWLYNLRKLGKICYKQYPWQERKIRLRESWSQDTRHSLGISIPCTQGPAAWSSLLEQTYLDGIPGIAALMMIPVNLDIYRARMLA